MGNGRTGRGFDGVTEGVDVGKNGKGRDIMGPLDEDVIGPRGLLNVSTTGTRPRSLGMGIGGTSDDEPMTVEDTAGEVNMSLSRILRRPPEG